MCGTNRKSLFLFFHIIPVDFQKAIFHSQFYFIILKTYPIRSDLKVVQVDFKSTAWLEK